MKRLTFTPEYLAYGEAWVDKYLKVYQSATALHVAYPHYRTTYAEVAEPFTVSSASTGASVTFLRGFLFCIPSRHTECDIQTEESHTGMCLHYINGVCVVDTQMTGACRAGFQVPCEYGSKVTLFLAVQAYCHHFATTEYRQVNRLTSEQRMRLLIRIER